MPAKSHLHADHVVDFFLRGNPGGLISPPAVYAALLTVAPSDPSSTGIEVADTFGYARTAVIFGAPENGSTYNTGTVTFPTATGGDWGTIVCVAIYDSPIYGTGTLLYYSALPTPKVVGNGDTASFAAGTLAITEQ